MDREGGDQRTRSEGFHLNTHICIDANMGAKHLSNGMDAIITSPLGLITKACTKKIKASLQHLTQQVIHKGIDTCEEKSKFVTYENL